MTSEVTVFVRPCREHDGCTEASSAFPEVIGCSVEHDVAINHVKGACLIAIGHWPKVPDVSFTIREVT